MKKIKKDISEFFEHKTFKISSDSDFDTIISPMTIFKPFLGSAYVPASSRIRRSKTNTFSKNFLSVSELGGFAEQIFSPKEIEEFQINLEELGFDFVRKTNIIGLVVKNPNLYTSELILVDFILQQIVFFMSKMRLFLQSKEKNNIDTNKINQIFYYLIKVIH